MINFLRENWRWILEIGLVICSAVLFILRKKPVKVVDTLKEVIIRVLPALINLAEHQLDLTGCEKMDFVLSKLKQYLIGLGYGDELISRYLSFAEEQAELILSTPQKKVR